MLLGLANRFKKSLLSFVQAWTVNSTQTRKTTRERVSRNSTSIVMCSKRLRANKRSNIYLKRWTKPRNLRWTKILTFLSISQILISVADQVLNSQSHKPNRRSRSSQPVLTSTILLLVVMVILISRKHLNSRTISSTSMNRMHKLDKMPRLKSRSQLTHLMSYLMCSMPQPKSLLRRHNKIWMTFLAQVPVSHFRRVVVCHSLKVLLKAKSMYLARSTQTKIKASSQWCNSNLVVTSSKRRLCQGLTHLAPQNRTNNNNSNLASSLRAVSSQCLVVEIPSVETNSKRAGAPTQPRCSKCKCSRCSSSKWWCKCKINLRCNKINRIKTSATTSSSEAIAKIFPEFLNRILIIFKQ